MVEELICAGLQCFNEHITKGIEALLQLASGINPGTINDEQQENREVKE